MHRNGLRLLSRGVSLRRIFIITKLSTQLKSSYTFSRRKIMLSVFLNKNILKKILFSRL